MEKEKKVKKEEKETAKDFSIEKKDQKRLKGISKVIYVLAKILKVFSIIGIVGIAIAMFTIPVIALNIKVTKGATENTLNIFDIEFVYTRSDQQVKLYEKGKPDDALELTNVDEVYASNKIFDYLEKNDLSQIAILLEVELLLDIVSLVIQILLLKKVYLFFNNLYKENSPFISENVDLLRKIAKLLVCSIIVSIITGVVSSFVFDSSTSVRTASVIEILIVCCMIYVFKYGVKLQNETKGKIYSKED